MKMDQQGPWIDECRRGKLEFEDQSQCEEEPAQCSSQLQLPYDQLLQQEESLCRLLHELNDLRPSFSMDCHSSIHCLTDSESQSTVHTWLVSVMPLVESGAHILVRVVRVASMSRDVRGEGIHCIHTHTDMEREREIDSLTQCPQ